MKTIKIFLASSEELDNDRMAFGNLVRRLDDMYEKRGIRIKLFEWEDYDAAYNDRRKQDEYNDYVRQSDVFLALFHKKAGKFTLEEFGIASEEFREHASPKVYTYCKDLKDGEEESAELKEFKQRLFNKMGHYWCRYDNRESLQFQFVMQLQLVESNRMDDVKVEEGFVTINGLPVAKMDKLTFAAANDDFVKMQTEIQELSKEIREMQIELEEKQNSLDTIEKTPNNEGLYKYIKNDIQNLIDKLQPKIDKKNKLKEDFVEHQQLLFNTAKRVAQLQGERITERMRRAMDALTEGKVREANIILDEAEADARQNLEDYLQSKEITEQKRQNVISSIEELQLKATSVMSDADIPIEERIEKAERIYKQAYEMAQKCDYDEEKYADLLYQYGSFLQYFAKYDEALSIFEELNMILESTLGTEHSEIAWSYNYSGIICEDKGDYDKALEYHMKALVIWEKVFGKENSYIATSYNNIGSVYRNKGDYDNALEYHLKALEIWENVFGTEHPAIAGSHHNIGLVYHDKGDYDKALDYYMKALNIWEKVLGTEHSDTALCYKNIGNVYYDKGDYDKALKYFLKALEVREKVLGKKHPYTVELYKTIGKIYLHFAKDCEKKGDYDSAIKYHLRALEMNEFFHGNKEHLDFIKQSLDSLQYP